MNWITTIDYYWPTQICKSSPICTNLPIVPQKNCQNLNFFRQFKLIQFVIFNFNNHYSTSSMEADIYGELVQIRGGGRKKYQRSWSNGTTSSMPSISNAQQHTALNAWTTLACHFGGGKICSNVCCSIWLEVKLPPRWHQLGSQDPPNTDTALLRPWC